VKSCEAVLTLAVLLLATASLALAQGTYTQIDYPGAAQTQPYGIDGAGDVVGYWTDASNLYHGFLFSGGTYTTIDYPGTGNTYLFGINDKGQIVGTASFGSTGIGFEYDIQTQAFTTVSYPGATATGPFAINDAGVIAGEMTFNKRYVGFVLSASTHHVVEPPLETYSSNIRGLAASGEPFGFANTSSGIFNFSFTGERYKHWVIPGNGQVNGVNPSGTAPVGSYSIGFNIEGFIYENGVLQTLEFPGAYETGATGINASGEVSGVFIDNSGNAHGFTWTPPADAEKK
jgi:hypothetical protein